MTVADQACAYITENTGIEPRKLDILEQTLHPSRIQYDKGKAAEYAAKVEKKMNAFRLRQDLVLVSGQFP